MYNNNISADKQRKLELLEDKYYKKMNKVGSYDKVEKEWNEIKKVRSEIREERDKAVKSFFSDPRVSEKVNKLHDMLKESDDIEETMLGSKSDAYKNAYKKYKETMHNEAGVNNDDIAYGFDHYKWREGNPDYDKAYSEYKSKAKALTSNIDNTVKNIGKTLTEEYYDKKVGKSKYDETYGEYAQFLLMQYTRFKMK